MSTRWARGPYDFPQEQPALETMIRRLRRRCFPRGVQIEMGLRSKLALVGGRDDVGGGSRRIHVKGGQGMKWFVGKVAK